MPRKIRRAWESLIPSADLRFALIGSVIGLLALVIVATLNHESGLVLWVVNPW